MILHFDKEEILTSDPSYRRNLINALSGYKSLNLIGTKSENGLTNLAPFSQVFHIGANPQRWGCCSGPTQL